MSSIASRQSDCSRSRLSGVVLLAALVLATPGMLQSQGTSDGPPRRDDGPAPRESTFVQRLAAAFLAALANRDTTSRQPPMPNVVGMDTTTAIRTLRALRRFHLSMSYVIVQPPRTSIPVDRIADQLPRAGTPLSGGASARFTLAGVQRPPDSVIVPRVIGLLADDAVRTLHARNLVEDRLERRVTAPDSIGRVTGQNPAAGTRLAVGGLVAIAIGQDARIFMPDVTGVALVTARERIRAAGIDVRRIQRDSVVATTSIGTVARQRPAANSVVSPTTPIVLTQAVRAPPRPDTLTRIAVTPGVVGRGSGTLGALKPVDPIPLPALPDLILALPSWLRRLVAVAIALAVASASALTARAIWPPPQIVPRIRIQPLFTDVVGAGGSLVDFSVSLRSHVEHERSELDLTGSPLE